MSFEATLMEFTAAVEAGDGKRLAALFTECTPAIPRFAAA